MKELLLELRHARAEAAFQAAAAGARGWCRDMALAAPLQPACHALPREPELLTLLDPLADSALATLSVPVQAAAAAAEPPRGVRRRTRFESAAPVDALAAIPVPGASQRGKSQAAAPAPSQGGQRRAIPPKDAAGSDIAAAGLQAVNTLATLAASSPARVAAWLARHGSWPAPAEPGASGGQLPSVVERQAGAKVIQLPLRREPGAAVRRVLAPPVEAVASSLLRWQKLLAAPEAGAALPRADSGFGLDDLTQAGQRLVNEVLSPAPASFAGLAAMLEPRKLAELAAKAQPAAPVRSRPGGEGESPAPAALPPQALEAITASLTRIEQRQVSAPAASPQPLPALESPQWFDADDDALAERIHAILRRQALRHGIGGP